MGAQATVTAKIPAEHKAKLREHGVNVNRLINDAVAREVRRLEDEEYRSLLKEAAKILQKVPEDHLVELIRKSRDER
jgi:post-segregation antitoxin (ccd killing protein)